MWHSLLSYQMINTFSVADATTNLTFFVWATFVLPAAVWVLVFAFQTLWFLGDQGHHQQSRRAMLRKRARFKPVQQRAPPWMRGKFRPFCGQKHPHYRIPNDAPLGAGSRALLCLWELVAVYSYSLSAMQWSTLASLFMLIAWASLVSWSDACQAWLTFKMSKFFGEFIFSMVSPVPKHQAVGLTVVETKSSGPANLRFDSNSARISVDNCCTRSLSNNINHFEDLELTRMGKCRGLGDKPGNGQAIHGTGTLVITIQDDVGGWHVVKLTNSLYVPGAEGVLLSPQHWAQAANDHFPKRKGTGYKGDDETVTLYWNQRKFKRTIYLDPQTNTGVFYSKPGSRIFQAFQNEFVACRVQRKHPEHTTQLPPGVQRQRELEGDGFADKELIPALSPTLESDKIPPDPKSRQNPLTFDPGITQGNSDSTKYFTGPVTNEPEALDKSVELMRWHYRLGHLSFPKL